MDREQLRNRVFERHGQRLDINDPVFALVALNEAVLDEVTKAAIDELHRVIATLVGESEKSNKALLRALDDAKAQLAEAGEAEKAKLDQRTRELVTIVMKNLGDTVNGVVKSAMAQPVADAVAGVDLAARGFNAAQVDLNTAKTELHNAANDVAWSFWQKAGAMCAAAVVGGLVTGTVMLFGVRVMLH